MLHHQYPKSESIVRLPLPSRHYSEDEALNIDRLNFLVWLGRLKNSMIGQNTVGLVYH